jgi:hypothetical protein
MDQKINLLKNDFYNSINNLQPNQLAKNFDFDKDFEMREIFDLNSDVEPKNIENNFSPSDIQNPNIQNSKSKELEIMLNSLPFINENIRSNISLSIEIYKKLNNFDYNYIHEIINEISYTK